MDKIDTIVENRHQYMASGFASGTSCYVKEAKGAVIKDINNKEYIDFAGGIAVMNVGHSHPKVIKAIEEQAKKFIHTCFMVLPYESAVDLAQKLCKLVPGDTPKAAMFANSGAEAVENAVKIARYYTKKQAVIAFESGFHGRTLMGMSLTSKVKPYKFGFGPYAPEIYRIPFAYCYRCHFGAKYPDCGIKCADFLKNFFISHTAPENTAAIIAEPVQGEGGYIVPPPEYFEKINNICKENNILFIADEIQTGIGRTGKMFAMEHWGVEADITTIAKSLAAGMPLSAVVGKKEIMNSVHAGGIGGTYGANPVACQSALAVLDIVKKEKLLQRSNDIGAKLMDRFNELKLEFDIIGDVRGLGAMMAIELVKNQTTKEPAHEKTQALTSYCFENGLILLSCGGLGNVIRFMMPLVITDDQLEQGFKIIENGLQIICSKKNKK